MSKSIREISEMAASWWGDKITKAKYDNGDDGMASFLATLTFKPVDIKVKTKFIKALTNHIEEKLNRLNDNSMVILTVDYGPCSGLRKIAEYSGVPINNFPWKTTMWIGKNSISERYGYNASVEYLYSNKIYWRHLIERTTEDIKEYKEGKYYSYIEDKDKRDKEINREISNLKHDIERYKKRLETAEE